MKRILSAFLAVIMVITMLPLEAMAASSTSTDSTLADTWDGKAATSFASGDGSESNPYVIVTAEQMAYFAQVVNAGNFGSKHVILANNIDLSGYSWTSIGSSSSCYFTGTFDGKGYTVSGLEITTTNGVAGLFGYTSGTIRNLHINITNVSVSYASGDTYIGAVAAYNSGYIYDVEVNGNITVKNAGNTSAYIYCGGIVGSNNNTIGRCIYIGNVNVTSYGGYYAGGIAGNHAAGTIFSSQAIGELNTSKGAASSSYILCIAGGIAGGSSSAIRNCVSTITVNNIVQYSSSNAIAGGIVGEARSESSAIEKCYATNYVYARSSGGVSSTAGGLLGYGRGSITNCYSGQDRIEASTNGETASSAGWLYGGNSCTVTNSYYGGSSGLFRVEAYTATRTEGSGCDEKEVSYTAYRGTTTPSNTGYTGQASVAPSLFSDTLKWGAYVSISDHASNPEHTWVFSENYYPGLHINHISTLTVNYHKDGVVDHVSCQWMDSVAQYSIEIPEIVGYTADKNVISGSLGGDTIIDVTYVPNIYNLTVVYKSTDGVILDTVTASYSYGESYKIAIPDMTGYTKQTNEITGIMGAEDTTVTAYYEANEYTLTVNYVYADTGAVAAETQQVKVKYGAQYSVSSPVIEGYRADREVVAGTMLAADQNVTVSYGTKPYTIRVVYQYENGETFSVIEHAPSYGQEFNYAAEPMDGYTPNPASISETVKANAEYTIIYSPNAYTLTVHYVNKETREQVAPSYVETVCYGQSYSIASPSVAGYTASQEVIAGTMPYWDETATVEYGTNMYSVRITYQYGDGTLIREEVVNVKFGEDYSIDSPVIQWHTPDKAFVTGTMPAHEVTETVVYTKNIIGNGACGGNVNWVLYEDGLLSISGQGDMYDFDAAAAPWDSLSSRILNVSIASGVTSIGSYAFFNCAALKTISIEETVTRIGDKAFFGCSALREVLIPQNVSVIGDGALSNCMRLSSILVDTENTHFAVEGGVLFSAGKDTLIVYPMGLYNDNYEIPVGVKVISPYAFYNNAYLERVSLPDTIERIGESAFENCTKIRKIQITSANVAVGNNAFHNSAVEMLIVEGNISELGDHAFSTSAIQSAYFKADAPAKAGEAVFGDAPATIERMCVYYPLENESWQSMITVATGENGYINEYWKGYHAYAFNGIGDVTLLNAGGEQIYATFVFCDKTPVADVSVTFNGVTRKSDQNGFTYFVYKNVNQVDLKIHKDSFISSYETSSAYTLKAIGVDYFNLTTNSSVEGISCYGNDITSEIAYINVKYEGMIPIVVKGNTEFSIEKMELIQEVRDSENPSGGYIQKVLQTISKGDESLSADGYCRFLVAASAFAYNINKEYPIYVRMYTSSGEDVVVEQLRIKTNSFKFTGDFENLVGDFSLQLSDTGVPFLDGIKLNLKTKADCPLSFKVLNNEVYITWDLDDYLDEELSNMKTEVEGTTTNQKANIDDTNTRIKNYMTKLSYKTDEKLTKGKLFQTKHTPDFSLQTSMAGGLCFVIGEDNELVRIQSYVKLAIEMKASWTADYLILYIPVTLEIKASATGEVEIRGLGFDVQSCKVLMPEFSFTSEISLQLSVGIGCRMMSAGVFGRLKLTSTVVLGEVTYFDGLVLSGEWGIYAKLDVGLFQLYGENSWKFAEVELIPKSTARKLFSNASEDGYLGEYNGLPVYDLSAYALNSPSVDVGEVVWSTGRSEEVEDNSYTYAKAQMISGKDTNMVMYLDVREDRNDYNAQSLLYRIYDKTSNLWSEPVCVDDNGTSDTSFAFAEYDGVLYVVYTEATKAFTEADAEGKSDQQMMVEISRSQEVTVCAYNSTTKRFEKIKNLSDNQHFDSTLAMKVINDKLYVAWVTNYSSDESLVFGMNGKNNVNICHYDGKTWSEPECIVSDCNPVLEMVLAELDGQANVAMVIDEDTNYYTPEDSNLYIADESGEITFVDCYGERIGNLQTCVYQDVPMLVWYCGGGINSISSVVSEPRMILERETAVTQDYQLVNLSDDILALAWVIKGVRESEDATEQSVVNMKLIGESGQWTDTSVAFYAPYYMMSYDLCGDDGDMRFIYTSTNMTINENTNDYSTYSKLCSHYLTTAYRVNTGETTNLEVNAETGKVSMDAEMTNVGLKTIKQVSVMVRQYKAGTTKVEKYHAVGLYGVNIPSGETQIIHFEADTIENVNLEFADIIVNPYEGTLANFYAEVNLLNDMLEGNTVGSESWEGGVSGGGVVIIPPEVTPITPTEVKVDLKVEGEYIIVGEAEYLSLKVTNVGKVPASGMINVAKIPGSTEETAETVYTANITDLPEQGMKYYLVELKKDFFDSTSETFECWISHCDEGDDVSNNRLTIVAQKMENSPGTQYDNDVIASELSSYNEVFDKYSSDDLELSITLNGNQFVGLRDESMNAHSVYVPNADGTVLALNIDKEYLKTLDTGFYEQVFLFMTESGYIDCVLNLTIEDNTPIDVRGSISIIGTPERGERLSVDISGLNTAELSYAWTVDGQVVSNDTEYIAGNSDLGKQLSVTVSGTGLYQGDATASVYINKVARTLNAPKLTVLDADHTVQLKKGFIVGDGTVEYGWAAENDSDAVANWSEENTFTVSDNGAYYMFTRVTGSEIYQDAVSDAVFYGEGYCLISWNVGGNITETAYELGQIPEFTGSTYKAPDESGVYKFVGWDDDGDGAVDIMPGSSFPAVTADTIYVAVYEQKAETSTPEKFNIAFSQVDMGNALGMNFAFPAVEGVDFTGAYAEATMAGSTQTISADKWTTTTIGGKTHYVFGYSNIAAKQMADEVSIVIYNAKGEAISNEYVDSIQSYVMRNVDKKDAESKALMVDMLNYGAAAQVYYGYNAADLANALLTDAQKAYGTAELTEITDIRVKGANYLGTRLELGSSIGMQMNFAGTTADMYAVIEFTNHSGKKISERVPPTEISGAYLINITQVAVADGRMPVTVTVYNADGTVYGSATDSMASYIARMSNTDELYAAIMKFSDSAFAYLH